MILDFKAAVAIGLVISSSLILSACKTSSTTSVNGDASQTQQEQTSQSDGQDEVAVTVSDSGFDLSEVTVKSGGKITWTNSSSSKVQVASDPHPIHTENKELTNGEFVADLAPGASVTVTVTKTGTWGYHDHLNAAQRGKVIVE